MSSFPNDHAIAHFDLDAFYVNVEYLRDARLRGKPIAVGGHSERGVVVSCSYEARKFGVHSAMPSRLAKRLCPELIIISGDMERYSKFSNLVTEIIRAEVPVFEKSSIDEFYIDLTGMDRFLGTVRFVSELRKKIVRESGLSISHALATNKLISKIATNECKPDGRLEVKPGDEKLFLAPLSIEKMPMIGNRIATLLHQMDIETIGNLSQIPMEKMIKLFGKTGLLLWARCQGIDNTPVSPDHEQKSIGTENTFERDTADLQFLLKELARMTGKIAFELRCHDKLSGCITIKIRYSDFHTITMQSAIFYTANDHILFKKVKELFMKLYDHRLSVRLIGVRCTNLVHGNSQINLFEGSQEMTGLYRAIDDVKKRFGEKVLIRASYI